MLHPPAIKLSICISTFNRAAFIAATLDTILPQLTRTCELIVVDGASTDDTAEVLSAYERRNENFRYFKQTINQGIDRDYDRAVQLARGEYCWLMTDDDLFKPGAVARVLAALQSDPSLVLVNFERRDNTMSEILLSRCLNFDADVTYQPNEIDRLFSDTRKLLIFIGVVVIKRSIWMTRNRERYYDSLLVHIGVIFQEPMPSHTRLIAEPLISYRDGNPKTFWPRMFEIFFVKFPAVVASLPISDREKTKYYEFLKRPSSLLLYRAIGCYSLREFRHWIAPRMRSLGQKIFPLLIAITPGLLVNSLYIAVEFARNTHERKVKLLLLRASPFHYRKFLATALRWN